VSLGRVENKPFGNGITECKLMYEEYALKMFTKSSLY